MTVNIIYTKGTVTYLSFFIDSLLHYTSFRFRLVANGCDDNEIQDLINLSIENERLEFWNYPSIKVEAHGTVLNYLQAMNRDKYFCFMDSDIFATSLVQSINVNNYSNGFAGLFGALPIWIKGEERIMGTDFKIMSGNYNDTSDNICLGSTYFAIYDNELLSRTMQEYAVGFEQIAKTDLSTEAQITLNKLNFKQQIYDTGKVINLLLGTLGDVLFNIQISEFCHIGGISSDKEVDKPLNGLKNNLRRVANGPCSALFPAKFKNKNWLNFIRFYKGTNKREYQINYNQKIVRRNKIRGHFSNLYSSLLQGKVISNPPLFSDLEIDNNILTAHESYIEIFKSFHKKRLTNGCS